MTSLNIPQISLPPIRVPIGEKITYDDLLSCQKFFPCGSVNDLKAFIKKQLLKPLKHGTPFDVPHLLSITSGYIIPFNQKGNIVFTHSEPYQSPKAIGWKGSETATVLLLADSLVDKKLPKWIPKEVSKAKDLETLVGYLHDCDPEVLAKRWNLDKLSVQRDINKVLSIWDETVFIKDKKHITLPKKDHITPQDILDFTRENHQTSMQREAAEETGCEVIRSEPYLHMIEEKKTTQGNPYHKDRQYFVWSLSEKKWDRKPSPSEAMQHTKLMRNIPQHQVIALQRDCLMQKFASIPWTWAEGLAQKKLSTTLANYIANYALELLIELGAIDKAQLITYTQSQEKTALRA